MSDREYVLAHCPDATCHARLVDGAAQFRIRRNLDVVWMHRQWCGSQDAAWKAAAQNLQAVVNDHIS